MSHQYVTAAEFKAKCLALLREIEEHGGSITVTKRGRPVAKASPEDLFRQIDANPSVSSAAHNHGNCFPGRCIPVPARSFRPRDRGHCKGPSPDAGHFRRADHRLASRGHYRVTYCTARVTLA